MSDLDPRIWAEAIARALTVGGERVPFQRVLSTHRAGLDALRARGLTWRSLAHLLAQAGARRPDGSPYDADHLRICVKRMSPPTAGSRSVAIRPAANRHTSHSSTTSAAIPRTHGDRPARPTPAQAQRPPPLRELSTDADKDVSSDEVALVRARLNQLRK